MQLDLQTLGPGLQKKPLTWPRLNFGQSKLPESLPLVHPCCIKDESQVLLYQPKKGDIMAISTGRVMGHAVTGPAELIEMGIDRLVTSLYMKCRYTGCLVSTQDLSGNRITSLQGRVLYQSRGFDRAV